VFSNNPNVHGAFAVLHTGHPNTKTIDGQVDHYESHPNGIVNVKFDTPRTTMKNLDVSFRKANGEALRVARIHLWFKLLVTEG
jgi:hypothetical protein